ncbi:hypothetical protein Btru_016120 [Bulinus truncatus]|nr:hypothetical protein Btru_016120 [Bulinus truncatus]
MMGYQNGQQTLKGNYGVGSKNFLLENMTCPLNATSLDNCTHYFLKTCGPQDDELYVSCNPTASGGGNPLMVFFTPSSQAGIPSLSGPTAVLSNQTLNHVCQSSSTPINVRIFSGSGNDTYGMGYIQMFINGYWVFVCQEGWNLAAAKVACQEMCFSSLGAALNFVPQPGIVRNYVPNPTNPSINVSDMTCSGNEASLFNCTFSRTPGLCLNSAQPTLAGVQCLPQNNTKITVPFPDVTCGNGVLSADFPLIKFPYITLYNVDFVPTPTVGCVNKTMGTTYFRASISVSINCGTVLKENATHLTYENTVRYVWLNNELRSYQYINQRYQLICSIPKTNEVTNRYQPYTLSPLNNLYGQYDFSLRLELYTTNTFQTPVTKIGGTYLVEVGDSINAAVVMQSDDNRLKVVTVECDALPVLPMAVSVPVEKLIHDKCPSHPSLTMYDLDNSKQGFRFQAILFSGYSMAYIKCTATVCLTTDASCKRMCGTSSGRKKRQTEPKSVDAQVQSLNILFYNSQSQDFQKLKSQLSSDSGAVVHSSPTTTVSTEEISNLFPTDEDSQNKDPQPASLQADELQIASILNQNSANHYKLNNMLPFCLIFVFILNLAY